MTLHDGQNEFKKCYGQSYTIAVMPHAALSGIILPNRTLVNPGGMDYSIIETLSLKLNFSFNLLTPIDQIWGVANQDGNWSGMVGMIQNSEADMAISTISISESRLQVVAFSYPYYYDSAVFVSKADDADTSDTLYFLQPFTFGVWCLVAMSILVQWGLTTLIHKILQNKNEKFGFKTLSLWLKQDFTWDIPLDFRLILGMFLLIANLMGCLYGCKLTSSTSVASKTEQIDSVADMVRAVQDEGYIVTTQKGSVFEENIKTSETESMSVIKPMMALNVYKTPEEIKRALNELMLEKRIFIFYESGLQSLVDSMAFHGKLHFSKEKLFSDRLAIAFPKDFKCTEVINHELRRQAESGLIVHWHFKMMRSYFYRKTNPGKYDRVTQESYIESDDLIKVFYMAAIGYGIASFIILIEFASQKVKDKSRKRSTARPSTILS